MLTSRSAQATVWIVLALAAAAAAAGLVFNWYQQYAWYDEVVHGVFGFAVTFALGAWLSGDVLFGWRDHAGTVGMVLVLLGLGIGGAWEILEFAYDHLSGPQSVIQGKFDTVIDLLCDTGGAFVAAVILVAAARS